MQGSGPAAWAGNRRVTGDPTAPRAIDGNADPNSRSPDDRSRVKAAGFDGQVAHRRPGAKVEAVLGQRDAKGLRQIARTTAEVSDIDVTPVWRTSLHHHRETIDRLE